MEVIRLFNTTISEEAKKLVNEALDSTFVSCGKGVDEFERALEDFGLHLPVTVNSGTSALHLALVAAGVGEGDEVILPAQTFIATGLAILYQKAVPVFADIEYETGNLSVDSLGGKITDKTKAVIPVHWGGYPCDMEGICEVVNENMVVIEDAAHALGATYKEMKVGSRGMKMGSLSDFTCFSFQAIKHLTTGDGGAVCGITLPQREDFKRKRWFGIDREQARTGPLGERVYNLQEIGYKYHMNDIAAWLGVGNLRVFPAILERHRQIAKRYTEAFSDIPGMKLFEYKEGRESSYWLYGLHVLKRDNFIRMMKSSGIDVSVVHQGIDRNDIFGGIDDSLYNQRAFDETQIHIPIHSGLSDEDVERIIVAIKGGC